MQWRTIRACACRLTIILKHYSGNCQTSFRFQVPLSAPTLAALWWPIVSELLPSKGATKVQKGISYMPNKYVIDFPQTYNGAVLQAVEPKMETDRNNPQAPMEQAKDKNGVPKWLVYLNLEAKEASSTGKKEFENVTVTVASPTKPFGAIPLNSPVIIERLVLGRMLREKGGGYNLYYSCDAIRPAHPARTAAAQS